MSEEKRKTVSRRFLIPVLAAAAIFLAVCGILLLSVWGTSVGVEVRDELVPVK